jgi:hypothetical protein
VCLAAAGLFELTDIDPNAIRMANTNDGHDVTQVIEGRDVEIRADTSRQLFSRTAGGQSRGVGRGPPPPVGGTQRRDVPVVHR